MNLLKIIFFKKTISGVWQSILFVSIRFKYVKTSSVVSLCSTIVLLNANQPTCQHLDVVTTEQYYY